MTKDQQGCTDQESGVRCKELKRGGLKRDSDSEVKMERMRLVFVPATAKGKLRRRFLQTIKKANVKVAVDEVPGRNVNRMIQRSDPLRSEV